MEGLFPSDSLGYPRGRCGSSDYAGQENSTQDHGSPTPGYETPAQDHTLAFLDVSSQMSSVVLEPMDIIPTGPEGSKRIKTGCITCRQRRIKCDETHPACTNCFKSKRQCLGYDLLSQSIRSNKYETAIPRVTEQMHLPVLQPYRSDVHHRAVEAHVNQALRDAEHPIVSLSLDDDLSDTASTDISSDPSSEIASTTPLQGVEHPLSPMKNDIVGSLLGQYDSYRQAQGGQSSNSNALATSGSDQGSQGRQAIRDNKRVTRPDDNDGGGSSGSEGRSSKRPKILGEAENPGKPGPVKPGPVKPWLACPFAKEDPSRYSDCLRKRLRRIRDVKQHLRRCHSRPIYCPVCGETFRTEEDRDTHARRRLCQETQYRIDGITKAQKDRLTEKSPLKTAEEAQWFAMFAIVFPRGVPAAKIRIRRSGPVRRDTVLWGLCHPRGAGLPTEPYASESRLEQPRRSLCARANAWWSRTAGGAMVSRSSPTRAADNERPLPETTCQKKTPTTTPAIAPLAPAAAHTNELLSHVHDDVPNSTQHGYGPYVPPWDTSSTNFPSSSFGFGDLNFSDNQQAYWNQGYLASPQNMGSSSTAFIADMDGAPGPSSTTMPALTYEHVSGDMEHLGIAKA